MLNRVLLTGRICADPELQHTSSDTPVCRVRLAVERPRRKDGESQTDFFSVNCWRQTAEFVCRNFKKGDWICFEAKLRVSEFTDSAGKHRSVVEIVADNAMFCGRAKAEKTESQSEEAATPQRSTYEWLDFEGFELPADSEPVMESLDRMEDQELFV